MDQQFFEIAVYDLGFHQLVNGQRVPLADLQFKSQLFVVAQLLTPVSEIGMRCAKRVAV